MVVAVGSTSPVAAATTAVVVDPPSAAWELGEAAVAADGECLKMDWPSEITPINAAPAASTAMARRTSRCTGVVGRFDRRGC